MRHIYPKKMSVCKNVLLLLLTVSFLSAFIPCIYLSADTVDKIPPAPCNLCMVTDKTTTITGTNASGTIVYVLLPGSSTKLTASMTTSTTWKFTLPDTLKSGQTISYYAVDAKGNLSYSLTQTVNDYYQDSNMLSFSDFTVNQLTNAETSLRGTVKNTSTTSISIEVLDTHKTYTAKVATDKTWSVDITPVNKDATVSITPYTATSHGTAQTMKVIDADSPSLTVDKINSGDTVISGTANAGATVTLTYADTATHTKTQTLTASTSGVWSTNLPLPYPTDPTLTITTTEKTNDSYIQTKIKLDKTQSIPSSSLTSSTSSAASSIASSSHTSQTTSSKVSSQTKSSIASSITTIPKTSSTVHTSTPVVSKPSSVASVQSTPAVITAASVASSSSADSEETVSTAALQVGKITPGSTLIGGTANVGATIHVTTPDGKTVETVADENGQWSAQVVTALESGQEVTILATIQNHNNRQTIKVTPEETAPVNPNKPYFILLFASVGAFLVVVVVYIVLTRNTKNKTHFGS